MAAQVQQRGALIAIDGTRGKDLRAAAAALFEALKTRHGECAISRFDASGLFGELAAGQGDPHISARTLTLVYAADLAFRLRWEIRPVLESGGIVIAAPYTETAVAWGAAAGLDEDWIRELLRFAPKPDYRALGERTEDGSRLEARPRARLRGILRRNAENLDAESAVEAPAARCRRAAASPERAQDLPAQRRRRRGAGKGGYWQPGGRAAPVCFDTSQRTNVTRASGNASIRSRSALYSAFGIRLLLILEHRLVDQIQLPLHLLPHPVRRRRGRFR